MCDLRDCPENPKRPENRAGSAVSLMSKLVGVASWCEYRQRERNVLLGLADLELACTGFESDVVGRRKGTEKSSRPRTRRAEASAGFRVHRIGQQALMEVSSSPEAKQACFLLIILTGEVAK